MNAPTPRRRRSRAGLTAAAAVLLALAAGLVPSPAADGRETPDAAGQEPETAQEPEAPAARPGFADRISVAWVLVPVLVKERRGGYVDDLESDDFRLLVDGEPVPIASFERGRDAPLSLVVLQDLSGSMENGGKIEASRRALAQLLKRVRPGDELALASFAGGRLAVDVPFTGNQRALAEAMDLWRPYGTTALHDAVAWIPEISAEGRHPKRAVLLVTDGVDNASVISPEAARSVIERAHLPVYVVGLGNSTAAAATEADGAGGESYARLLRRLAWSSGGAYFAARRPAEVGPAVRATLEALRREYVLSFPVASGGESVFRQIRVEARGGRLSANHRLGYTGGPPTGELAAGEAAAAAGPAD